MGERQASQAAKSRHERTAHWGTSILDASLDAALLLDADGTIVDCNDRSLDLLESTRESLAERSLESLIYPTDRSYLRNLLDRFEQRQGKPPHITERLEVTLQSGDGGTLPVEISIAQLAGPGDALLLAFLRDLTSRKRTEERLTRQAKEARLLQQATTLAAETESIVDALRGCVDIVCEFAGWPVGHAYLLNVQKKQLVSSDIWHFDEPERHRELRQVTESSDFDPGTGLPGRIWDTGEPAWIANVYEDKDFPRASLSPNLNVVGAFGFPVKVRFETVAILEFFANDEVAPDPQLLMTIRHVGEQVGRVIERKRAEQERIRLADMVDSSYDAIIGKSLDGTITSWNNGAVRVYGYTSEEAVGQPISIINPEGADREAPEILEVLTSGERLEHFETVRRRKDGRLINVSMIVSPIWDSSGVIVGTSTIERDMTERKRAERALLEAKEQAELANRSKSEFLANISHELRTPMNAIIGMAELALGESLTPVVRDYLETARESAGTLLSLVNDLLDFSRLETGRFELDTEPFSLRDVLDETMKAMSLRAHEKGLELSCHARNNVPDWLEGDPRRLRQILANLVGNALKFTDQGEVFVDVTLEQNADNKSQLKFAVTDTGTGIAPENLERIFSPFTQADASITRAHTGTGLGLAICRELVELMNGRIWVESEPGRGSRFYFTAVFPRVAEPEQIRRIHSRAVGQLRDLPVLVVDDNENSRRILRDMLANWSMQPTVASSGEDGMAEFRRAARDGSPYPLVIVDALMPRIDGVTLIETIRDDGLDAGATILMLASADRQMFDKRCRSLGISAFLEKPVSQSDLLDAVMTALKGPQLDRGPVTSLEPTDKPLSVLLAEDTPANQKVAEAILRKRGHEVAVAHNGREAMELHKQREFDVILMDVQMPTMDGLQATKAIRRLDSAEKSSVPIIAITAHAMRGDRERCLSAGMDYYISKPINAIELVRSVERYAKPAACHQPRSSGKKLSVNMSRDDANPAEDESINLDAALGRLGGDADLLRDMIGFFREDSPKLLESIRNGIRNGQADDVTRSAHSLKGLASNFDFEPAIATAKEMEEAGRDESLHTAAEILPRLEHAVAQLNDALSRYDG